MELSSTASHLGAMPSRCWHEHKSSFVSRQHLSALSTSSSSASQPLSSSSSLAPSPTPSNSKALQSKKSNGKPSSHLMEYFVAGGTAGAASRTVVSPLERIKIIFQVQGPGSSNYNGIWSSLVKIGRDEGWKGYFRGNGINVVRIAPYSAIQFTSYEQVKKLLSKLSSSPSGELTTPLRLTAGACAGVCSVVSTYPLDLVRSRLSIISAQIGTRLPSKGKEIGMWSMAAKVYREEGGVRGLYRGLIPTAVGVAPYVGSNFAFYEFLKQYITPPDRPTSALAKLGCGALAGACSQTVTYPLDVLRRRMQVVGMQDVGFKYNGALHAVGVIVKNEGVRGLYKGLWPNLLKVAPSIGVSFLTCTSCAAALISTKVSSLMMF